MFKDVFFLNCLMVFQSRTHTFPSYYICEDFVTQLFTHQKNVLTLLVKHAVFVLDSMYNNTQTHIKEKKNQLF